MSTPDSSKTELAHLAVHDAPSFVWSFEETDAFAFELTNHAMPEIAAADAGDLWNYTAEVFKGGEFVRRVAVEPLPGPVPVGGSRVFDAHLGLSLIGGEYDLRFGLERRENGNGKGKGDVAAPVLVRSTDVSFLVKNQIMEAFVELINACNFRCTFCPQTTLKRKQRPMDFELATKIVGDLADMGHHHPIRVHLLGEPLLYPRFFDFVEAVHDKGQRIFLLTNGSRFTEETIEGIFRVGVDELLISLNTPEEKLYNEQRGTSMPYDKYMDGIGRMVHESVVRTAPPKLTINVLYDQPKKDHPEEIARVNLVVNEWVNVVRAAHGERPLREGEVNHIEGVLKNHVGTPDNYSVLRLMDHMEIQFSPYHDWGEGESPNKHFCSYPWRQLAILVDGQATACCVDAEGEICLGNASTQTIEEIWNGPEISRMRDGLWNHLQAVESRCVRCPIRHWDVEEKYRTHTLTQ